MDDELQAELASEHHDRIESVEEKLGEVEDKLEQEIELATITVPPHDHPEYAPAVHDHPDYVTRSELESRLASVEDKAEDALDTAEEAVLDIPAEAEEGVHDIPMPEPEHEPEYEYRRIHGRKRRVEKA